jgi:hypothetical protein
MHVDLLGDQQKDMPAVDSSVVSLQIWHCKYRSVDPVRRLRKLRKLVICPLPDGTLDFLSSLKELRQLTIQHLPKVRDLSPLATLRRLETLGLSTLASWDASGRVVEVRSLAPIADLPRLKYLTLFGIVPKTRSLRALERCDTLLAARFLKYRQAEVQRFYEATGVSSEYPDERDAG